MTPRYLAIVTPNSATPSCDIAVVSKATGLMPLYTSERITVLCDTATAVISVGQGGAVLGTIIHRHGPNRAAQTMDEKDCADAVASDGQALLERFWGAYVAFVDHRDRISVLRDPSGGLPCLFVRHGDQLVCASDLDLLVRSGLLAVSIDWAELTRGFWTNGLPSPLTAINGLTELLPGFRLNVTASNTSAQVAWNPWEHARIDVERTAAERQEDLRRKIQNSVSAWASSARKILVGVSGGLDSSILATCLSQDHAEIVCVTMVTTDGDGDERLYARALAAHLGIELLEIHYSLSDIDVTKAATPHLPRPTSRTQSLAYDAAMARVAKATEADAFFSGNGGDNVFAYSHSASAVCDQLLSHGPGPGMFRAVKDVCALTGCSPFDAMKSALRLAARRDKAYRWRPEPIFLHADRCTALRMSTLTHPWLSAPGQVLPGKAAHVALLLRILPHLQAAEPTIGTRLLTPLMTQPVMEACLHFPSWEWCEGGINRAVARRAFDTHLPPVIAGRKSKGGPDSFCNEIIDAHRGLIRERLLDGHLARHQVVDGASIARALDDEAPNLELEQVRILALLEAEAWADYWLGRGAAV